MKDISKYLEKLECDAAECEMIAHLTTDGAKREVFLRLTESFRRLADELRGKIEKSPPPDGRDN